MPDDNFTAVGNRILLGVKDIDYRITDIDDGTDAMSYSAQLLFDDGSLMQVSGNVVPHLTSAELSGLQALIARLRGKAETAWGAA